MQSVDLIHGMVPITKAASSLAQIIKFAGDEDTPVVVTQKGYPTGVILTIQQFTSLCHQAQSTGHRNGDTPRPDEAV